MDHSLPKTPFDGLTDLLKVIPSWVFPAVSILSIIFSFILSLHDYKTLFILIPLSITIGLVPLFVKIGATILFRWKDETADFLKISQEKLDQLYDNRFKSFGNVTISFFIGFAAMSVATVFYWSAHSFLSLSFSGRIIGWMIFGCSTFVCGIGLFSIVHLTLFFRDIGKYPVETVNSSFGIMSSGQKLLQCYLLGFVAWFLYSFSGIGVLDYSADPMFYLSLPSFIFLVGSFFFAQYPLHKRMMEYKKKKVMHILHLIDRYYPKDTSDINKEQMELLKHLMELSKEAANLPEWPFRFRTFLGVLSGAFGAVSPAFISIGIKYYFG